MAEKICLNLGCFNKKLPGFINVDVREDVHPDVVDDAIALSKFEPESVDVIYACHMLEHFSYSETNKAITRWHEVLKKDGTLRLSVPDLEKTFAHYFLHKNLDLLMCMLYGSQKHDYDFHKNGWDYKKLEQLLQLYEFYDIKRWDWKTIKPHSYCDDYSQAYLPHMDKENGVLMSLNVEATKK